MTIETEPLFGYYRDQGVLLQIEKTKNAARLFKILKPKIDRLLANALRKERNGEAQESAKHK
jgi:hypothetical protein